MAARHRIEVVKAPWSSIVGSAKGSIALVEEGKERLSTEMPPINDFVTIAPKTATALDEAIRSGGTKDEARAVAITKLKPMARGTLEYINAAYALEGAAALPGRAGAGDVRSDKELEGQMPPPAAPAHDVDNSDVAVPFMSDPDDGTDAPSKPFVPMWLKSERSKVLHTWGLSAMAKTALKAPASEPTMRPSHVSMDGGTFYFTHEQSAQALQLLAAAIEVGDSHMWVERPSVPFHNDFNDLDFWNLGTLPPDRIVMIVKMMQKVAWRFFEGRPAARARATAEKRVTAARPLGAAVDAPLAADEKVAVEAMLTPDFVAAHDDRATFRTCPWRRTSAWTRTTATRSSRPACTCVGSTSCPRTWRRSCARRTSPRRRACSALASSRATRGTPCST